MIREMVEAFVASLKETERFPGAAADGPREPPTALLWAMALLAQHHDRSGNYGQVCSVLCICVWGIWWEGSSSHQQQRHSRTVVCSHTHARTLTALFSLPLISRRWIYSRNALLTLRRLSTCTRCSVCHFIGFVVVDVLFSFV